MGSYEEPEQRTGNGKLRGRHLRVSGKEVPTKTGEEEPCAWETWRSRSEDVGEEHKRKIRKCCKEGTTVSTEIGSWIGEGERLMR